MRLFDNTPRPFSDFFETFTKDKAQAPPGIRETFVDDWGPRKQTVWRTIGNYICSHDAEFRSGYAKPTPAVVQYIKENMIRVNYDTIHFTLCGGTIRAEFGQIIGSHVLGEVDPDTIPAELRQ